MRYITVYDSPTRLFHWLFAGLFITAFTIANMVDDDSVRFSLHMLAGLGMVFVVALRLLWAMVGTRHARFGDLSLSPSQLVAYFKGMFAKGGRRWSGHNPASSWAAVAMVGLAIGLGTTGILMASGWKTGAVKELHELMANAFLIVVLLHVGGVLAHMLRHRDRLGASMVTGRKQAIADDQAPVHSRPIAGAIFLALFLLFMGGLRQGYDAQARTLELFGKTLQLGEHEDEHRSANLDEHKREHEDHANSRDD